MLFWIPKQQKPQAGALSLSSSATAPQSEGSPGISPRLSLPQKMPFPPGMHRPGGAAAPALPSRSCCRSPAAAPPSSRRLPAALMLLISCPEAPVLPPVFLTALTAPGSLCGRVKGKQAAEAAPGWAGSLQLPEAAVPPSKCSSHFFTPSFQLRFSSLMLLQQGGHREEKNAGWGHPQLSWGSCCPSAVPPAGQHMVATTLGIPRASLPSSVVITSPPSDFLLFPLGSSTDTHRCNKRQSQHC